MFHKKVSKVNNPAPAYSNQKSPSQSFGWKNENSEGPKSSNRDLSCYRLFTGPSQQTATNFSALSDSTVIPRHTNPKAQQSNTADTTLQERADGVLEPKLSLSLAGPIQCKLQALKQHELDSKTIQARALQGVQGAGEPLPYLDKLQAAFGNHDLSQVRAYTNASAAKASQALNAKAYAMGNKIAFASPQPDLYVAAHEAAHIIQQRGGVQLKGNISSPGDRYEQEADQVAAKVVQGESAQGLLDQAITRSGQKTSDINAKQAMSMNSLPIQRYIDMQDGKHTKMSKQDFVDLISSDSSVFAQYNDSYIRETVDYVISNNHTEYVGFYEHTPFIPIPSVAPPVIPTNYPPTPKGKKKAAAKPVALPSIFIPFYHNNKWENLKKWVFFMYDYLRNNGMSEKIYSQSGYIEALDNAGEYNIPTARSGVVSNTESHVDNWQEWVNRLTTIPMNIGVPIGMVPGPAPVPSKHQQKLNAAKVAATALDDTKNPISDAALSNIENVKKFAKYVNKNMDRNDPLPGGKKNYNATLKPIAPTWQTEKVYHTGIGVHVEYEPGFSIPKGSGGSISTPLEWFYGSTKSNDTGSNEGRKTIWTKGHLLNDHVGGQAKNYNLSPIAPENNTLMENFIESKLKLAVTSMLFEQSGLPQTPADNISKITYDVNLGPGARRAATEKLRALQRVIEEHTRTNLDIATAITNTPKKKVNAQAVIDSLSGIPNFNSKESVDEVKLREKVSRTTLKWEMEDYLVRNWFLKLKVERSDGTQQIDTLKLDNLSFKPKNEDLNTFVLLGRYKSTAKHFVNDHENEPYVDLTQTYYNTFYPKEDRRKPKVSKTTGNMLTKRLPEGATHNDLLGEAWYLAAQIRELDENSFGELIKKLNNNVPPINIGNYATRGQTDIESEILNYNTIVQQALNDITPAVIKLETRDEVKKITDIFITTHPDNYYDSIIKAMELSLDPTIKDIYDNKLFSATNKGKVRVDILSLLTNQFNNNKDAQAKAILTILDSVMQDKIKESKEEEGIIDKSIESSVNDIEVDMSDDSQDEFFKTTDNNKYPELKKLNLTQGNVKNLQILKDASKTLDGVTKKRFAGELTVVEIESQKKKIKTLNVEKKNKKEVSEFLDNSLVISELYVSCLKQDDNAIINIIKTAVQDYKLKKNVNLEDIATLIHMKDEFKKLEKRANGLNSVIVKVITANSKDINMNDFDKINITDFSKQALIN